MAKRYADDVEFLLIYVREAHPDDTFRRSPANVRAGIDMTTANTMDEKTDNADVCVRELGIEFPTLVDNMDNKVELAYAGFPDRLYLIGTDGRIVYKSAPGPAGFIASQLETAIKNTLGK